jgi:hypothetical protein
VLDGPRHNVRSRAQAKPIEHALQVILSSALTDHHYFSDLAIAQSARDKRHQLSLTRQQRRWCFAAKKVPRQESISHGRPKRRLAQG